MLTTRNLYLRSLRNKQIDNSSNCYRDISRAANKSLFSFTCWAKKIFPIWKIAIFFY